jgi:capsular polysaccharide biosynthesis protein
MNESLKNTSLAKWLWHHKISLLIVQVLAITASIIFSSPKYIKPEYKSYAVLYPYNMASYSRESSTEQMLQFLNSVDIKHEVIREFGLIKYYKIDTNKKFWYSRLLDIYDKNICISPTEFEAVEIKVYDYNPDTASEMVEGIINIMNKKVLAIQRQKSFESAKLYKKLLDIRKRQVDSLTSISKQLSVQYGLLDYTEQTKEVLRAYYQMLSSSKSGKPFEETSAQVKNLEEKGQEFKDLEWHLKNAVTNYDEVLSKYEDAVNDENKQITYSNVVENPFPAYNPSYPIRWLVILATAMAAFIFSSVVLLTIEKIRE